jgi:CheY-like chemotaxis protein
MRSVVHQPSKSHNTVAHPKPESFYRDKTESFREPIPQGMVMAPRKPPRILVVDDDETFGRLISRAAEIKGAKVTYCQSMDEVATMPSFDFDAIVMDYDLGDITGVELAKRLERFAKCDMPAILVSQSRQTSSRKWPHSIREFVHKSLGPFTILDAAFEACEIAQIHKSIAKAPTRR